MINIKKFLSFIKNNRLYIVLLILIVILRLISTSGNLLQEEGLKVSSQRIKNIEEKLANIESLKESLINQNKLEVYFQLLIFITIFILVFVVGAIIDIVFIVLKTNRREIIPKIYPFQRVNWSLVDVFRIIILYLSISYLISFGCGFIGGFFNLDMPDKIVQMATNITLSYSIIFILLIYFVVFRYKNRFKMIGLHFKSFFKNVFLGTISYVAIVPILGIVIFITTIISSYFRYTPKPHPVLNALLVENRLSLIVYLLLFVCILGPVVEEIFFRGFFYAALKKSIGKTYAILMSALFFAWLHMTLVGFFPILILGILLAYLYEKNGTLIPSIIVHIVHNSATTAFLLILKGLSS